VREPGQVRLLQIIHDNSQRLDRMVQDVLQVETGAIAQSASASTSPSTWRHS